MRTTEQPESNQSGQRDNRFPDLSVDGASAEFVRASWDRCESEYGLNPFSRLLGNRYSQSELISRLESVEEPLARADSVISKIRRVVSNADYAMLIADTEGAAVAEYCDSAMARQIKDRGITVGTLWDEPCVGTNGIGTSLASGNAITVNGDQHFHSRFRQFICSAALLVDHRGKQYGAINLTGNATSSQTEAIRVSQYVRRCAQRLHTYVFRDYFRHHALVAVTESMFSEDQEMSRLLALDESGVIVGATNDLISSLENTNREELVGEPIQKLIGVDYDELLSDSGRLHRLEDSTSIGRYAVTTPAKEKRAAPFSVRNPRSKTNIDKGSELGLDEIAGSDRRMKKMVGLCRRMLNASSAAGEIPILLQGETGTGKDTFAQALHRESRRSCNPFIELNCAAIPESLIDSELFGYAPGTFTGGLKGGKSGYIAAANGGTLFLDEIGDMPLDSQTRLLRVLAEHKVQPVGAVKSVDVNFQLVCASHRDLTQLVSAGRFREDLYYRICGAKLSLPALRDRQDIDDISSRLLVQFDPDGLIELSTEVKQRLRQCQWPGNIRQLHNVLQYMVFSCGEGVATLDDLPESLDNHSIQSHSTRSTINAKPDVVQADLYSTDPSHSPGNGASTVYRSRAEELNDALRQCRWCVTDAAKVLGVSRATVHRQMKKHGIKRPV